VETIVSERATAPRLYADGPGDAFEFVSDPVTAKS
jgi:hypothetical protein